MKSDNIPKAVSGNNAGTNKSNANIGVLKRSLRKQVKDKYWNYKPKDAIDGPMDLHNPPKENMYFEYYVMAWVPKSFDRAAFDKEKAAVIEAEYQRLLDITPNPNNPGFSLAGKLLSSDVQAEDGVSSSTTQPVERLAIPEQPEQQYNGVVGVPKETSAIEVESELKTESVIPYLESQKSDMPQPQEAKSELEPRPSPEQTDPTAEPQPEAVEQSKKTRRSAKMVESDFDTLAAQFICPAELAEKKPLFFPEKTREALRKIAGLVPGGKVSPSHIANHVIEAWIDENRDLFNRMFANQKTSI